MDRRKLMQVVSSTALAHTVVTVAGCHASSSPGEAKQAKHHEEEHGKTAPEGGASPAMKALATAAAECVVAGDICLEHCLRLLSTGSPMMAACARQVQQMLAVCRATGSLAAMGSEYATEMAKLCEAACTACAQECEAHAGHHAECAACFEACKKTIAAVKALA